MSGEASYALLAWCDSETSTVGGVISGYWAMSNVRTAMPPASAMTIDGTEAKIGRLIGILIARR